MNDEPSAATLTEAKLDDMLKMAQEAHWTAPHDPFVRGLASKIEDLVPALRAARHAQQQNAALVAAADRYRVAVAQDQRTWDQRHADGKASMKAYRDAHHELIAAEDALCIAALANGEGS